MANPKTPMNLCQLNELLVPYGVQATNLPLDGGHTVVITIGHKEYPFTSWDDDRTDAYEWAWKWASTTISKNPIVTCVPMWEAWQRQVEAMDRLPNELQALRACE